MSDKNKTKENFDLLERQYNKLLYEHRVLKARLEQYQQIFDLLPEYIFGIDENGQYLLANKQLADEFNVPVNEMEGKMDYEVIADEEELKSHQQMREKVLATGEPVYIPEFLATNRDGNKIPVEIRPIPYVDSVTGLSAVLGTTMEITERKRIEKELIKKKNMEKDIEIARAIQQGLLPDSEPVIEGFEISGWNQPADDTGGDYYDWLELPEGELAFTIADASGHGVGPALMAAVCRAYMRASHAGGEKLESMMANVNNLLADDLKDGRFITAVVGILYPQKHTLDIYSAGHAPLFFYNAAKDIVETWGADDIPLGIEKKSKKVSPRTVTFSPGDLFVMLTDGFFSLGLPDESEKVIIEKIKSTIYEYHSLVPKDFISSIYDKLNHASNNSIQQDDLTAVVLKCNI